MLDLRFLQSAQSAFVNMKVKMESNQKDFTAEGKGNVVAFVKTAKPLEIDEYYRNDELLADFTDGMAELSNSVADPDEVWGGDVVDAYVLEFEKFVAAFNSDAELDMRSIDCDVRKAHFAWSLQNEPLENTYMCSIYWYPSHFGFLREVVLVVGVEDCLRDAMA